MEEIIKICVENGLGISSFVALMYFIFKYVGDINKTMNKISDTMTQMQINMATMTDRVDKIEEKVNKDKE